MTAFKLLAIRPLQDCHTRFIKNLSPGLIYKFYQNFDFLNENDNAVKQAENVFKIKRSQAIPENLYDVKSADGTELKISISAIAGKNGSGKSSLIELLFAIVYVFSVEHRLLEMELTSPETAGNLRNDIRSFQIQLLELWAKKNEDYEELKTKHSGDIPFEALEREFTLSKEEKYLNSRLKQLQKDLKNLPDRLENLTNFKDQLQAELYFEVDGKYFQIKCDPGNSLSATGSIWAIGDDGTRPVMVHLNEAKEHLQRLIFYTISVNYSHHSLNSLVIGEWINSLFHKNDGYRTPLVINPMRTKGNFDINREMSLVKYRLLSNLLVQKYHDSEKPLWVTDNQIVEKIVFRLNMEKVANLEASLDIPAMLTT